MSEWKESGIKRRDFRHTHGEPEIPRHRKKAKRKVYCKGEHQWCEWHPYKGYSFADERTCSICNKHEIEWKTRFGRFGA